MTHPKQTPRALAPDLWVVEHALKLSAGVALGTRSTIVRLRDGGLWVHSPGPLTPDLAEGVRAMGEVRVLVAPNLWHHLFLEDWRVEWPEARVYATPGLAEKQTNLHVDEVLADAAPAVWKGEIEQLRIAGMPKMNEFVFRHVESGTLVLTDLCFNMRESDSWWTRFFMRINGVWQTFGPSRLFKTMVEDRDALEQSVDRLLEWEFERVIVAHGDVVESDGYAALERARPAFSK
ncbi:MAG: hypothetical protein CL931_13710 [Deltaproteobacteria bacterium]|nr:hypothetical protein [Deltaproteobacteria bacterium]